jgi:hypothetical protein
MGGQKDEDCDRPNYFWTSIFIIMAALLFLAFVVMCKGRKIK